MSAIFEVWCRSDSVVELTCFATGNSPVLLPIPRDRRCIQEEDYAMKTNRTALVIGLALIPVTAMAAPAFVKTFADVAKPPANSPLAKVGCLACHSAVPKLNSFGADISKAMKALKTKTFTPAVLKQIESLDSDKDGVKNVAEIKKGTLPGDPKSK
jgi:hypothetical protein